MSGKSKSGRWGFGAMLVVMVAIMAFIEILLPKITSSQAQKAAFPKLDQQYVKLSKRQGAAGTDFANYSQIPLPEEDQKLLMTYINFGGRSWTKQEEIPASLYRAEVNDKQSFCIEPVSVNDELIIELVFVNTEEEGTVPYSARITGNPALAMLQLLQKNQ